MIIKLGPWVNGNLVFGIIIMNKVTKAAEINEGSQLAPGLGASAS